MPKVLLRRPGKKEARNYFRNIEKMAKATIMVRSSITPNIEMLSKQELKSKEETNNCNNQSSIIPNM